MSFLKAEWRKLAMINYEVDPKLLEPYVPFGTELDFYEGKCFISLIGFMFLNTKVLGMKVPFHVNFEEVNLRFYVKRKEENGLKRGVVFIKEIVPKAALSFVANTIYGEHYVTKEMSHSWKQSDGNLSTEYAWKEGTLWQRFQVKSLGEKSKILANTEEEFITEHYWGYTKINAEHSSEYEVTHPRWQQYKVIESQISVDFGLSYGKSFSFLTPQNPSSIILSEGSEITVEEKRSIKS